MHYRLDKINYLNYNNAIVPASLIVYFVPSLTF